MAELRLVKPMVESSNLSSSAKWVSQRWWVGLVCKTSAFGLNKFESYHSHNGESPVGRGNCLENSRPPKGDQGFDSLSLRKTFGELAERYCTGLLSQGWGNTQVSSILTLSAMFVMSEFDNEEIVISQYSLQTNGRIAPMAEHCVEAATVQVRILFRPQNMSWV